MSRYTPLQKLKHLLLLSGAGATTFASLCLLQNDARFYSRAVMPLAHRLLEAEKAHELMVWALKKGLVMPERPHRRVKEEGWSDDDVDLSVDAFGLRFSNGLGMAAGFDKHGEAVSGLRDLGFGFVEIGSVTPKMQPGNPRPRVFRLTEDEAVINRYGFNSEGHNAVFDRLVQLRQYELRSEAIGGLLGVNLGKNKFSDSAEADYAKGVQKFGSIADYLVINVSSPNTPGLRSLQTRGHFESLISSVLEARSKCEGCRMPDGRLVPVLVKVAPDLSSEERREIARVAMKHKVDGLIVSNTTVSRPPTLKSPSELTSEAGGLSGKPLGDLAKETLSDFYTLTKGTIPLVGVGGISSGKDALERVKCGASLLQIYSALVFHGPPVVHTIKRELRQELRKEGFKSLREAVGANHRK